MPPEGPGSAQADVYSLGKVLYEVATGKDGAISGNPEELHPDTDPKQWIALNRVLCDICDPKISKRTITSASPCAALDESVGKKVGEGKAFTGVLWLAC